MGYFKSTLEGKLKSKRLENRSDMGGYSFNYDASISSIRRALSGSTRLRNDTHWIRENLMQFLPKIKVLKGDQNYSVGHILLLQDIISFLPGIIPLDVAMFLDSKIGDHYATLRVKILSNIKSQEDQEKYSIVVLKNLKSLPDFYLLDNYVEVARPLLKLMFNNESIAKYLYDHISTMNSDKLSIVSYWGWHTEDSHLASLRYTVNFWEQYISNISKIERFSPEVEMKISLAGKPYVDVYINWLKKLNPEYGKN